MIRSGVSGNIAQYCADHWTLKTTISYHYKLRYWMQYNEIKKEDPYVLTKEKTLQFLIHLFKFRRQHVRSIKAAFTVMRVLCRAAACPFSKEDAKQVSMLLQGMFVQRPDPVLPSYSVGLGCFFGVGLLYEMSPKHKAITQIFRCQVGLFDPSSYNATCY